MLNIDGQELKIIKQQIKVDDFIVDGIKGYDINIQLEFTNENKNGYLNLSAGYEKNNNIINFINKEYVGIPFDTSFNQINFFEVYDTDKFLDTEIESEIILKLKDIINNKIETYIIVKDDLINIEFKGYLDIII